MSAPWWWGEGAADGIDRYDGPFPTRQAAVDAARREVDPLDTFTIMEADMLDDTGMLANVTAHEELRA
jgi:hypothetical protein